MKKYLGTLLLVVGIVVFAVEGISYTTEEEVLDIGPLEVTADTEKTIALPPVLGGLALLGGAGLLLTSRRS